MSKSLCQQFAIGIVIIFTMWFLGIGFLFNMDDSLPYSFFFAKTNPSTIPRGSYVVFDHEVLGKKKRLVKKVLGISKDSVQVENDNVWINEQWVGKSKPYSKEGHPLRTIKSGIIPEQFVFVAGTHPDSFDSRYEDFGLVPIQKVLARAYPVF